jgi:hypothetical protein
MPVTIERVTDVGSELRCAVRLQSGERVEISQPTDAASLLRTAAAGTTARLEIRSEAIRFFVSEVLPHSGGE